MRKYILLLLLPFICAFTWNGLSIDGGTVSGTGTQNKAAKWSSGGANIEDSSITDDGTNVVLGADGTGKNQTIYMTKGTELAQTLNDTLWVGGTYCVINNGGHYATFSTGAATLSVVTPSNPNTSYTYLVTFTISGWTAGLVNFTYGGVTSTPFSGNQTVSIYVNPYTTGDIVFTSNGLFSGVISQPSIKRVTNGNLTVENDINFYDNRGHVESLGLMARHIEEMETNTLLDKSRSTLSCVDSVLTYTLSAITGKGTWNFNGVVYPVSVASGSVTLTGNTDAAPVINYVYFHLVGNTPTLVKATSLPTTEPYIEVARFLVGAISGTSYTIYGYDRARIEVDSFISRTLSRLQDQGTLYKSGYAPTITNNAISIASGGKHYNGVFEMTSANTVTQGGFYWIDGLGAFHYSTTLGDLVKYGDGSNTTVTATNFQNIVWGVVPTTTTAGGTVATTVKLFAVLQSAATTYNSAANAIADASEAIAYYPPNAELKRVFVPIARTVLHPNSTIAFGAFGSGTYFQDLRGKITVGGGAAVATDLSSVVPTSRTITATAPLTIGGTTSADLSADRTIAISANPSFTTVTANTSIAPATFGAATVGTTSLPFSHFYMGASGGTYYFDITGTPGTSSKTITIPNVTGTVVVAGESTTTTQAMFATATTGAPAFRAIAAGDLPGTLTSGTAITNAALTTPTLGVAAATSINSSVVGWNRTTGTFTATPASTSTITMTTDLTATIIVGMPLKYKISTTYYYGIVSAIASNLLTVAGAPLGGDVLELYYGPPEKVTQMVVSIPATYEDATNATLIATDVHSNLIWQKAKSYLVKYTMWSATHDSTTHGQASVVINGTGVNTTAGGLTIAADATLYSTVVDIDTAAYDINNGEAIEISAVKNGTGDATYLVATLVFVTP